MTWVGRLADAIIAKHKRDSSNCIDSNNRSNSSNYSNTGALNRGAHRPRSQLSFKLPLEISRRYLVVKCMRSQRFR